MIDILPDAAESIDAIGAWLFEQSGATVARRWLSRVESTFVFLERWPRTGGAFDTIDLRFKGVRLWPTKDFPHYLVFYTVRFGAASRSSTWCMRRAICHALLGTFEVNRFSQRTCRTM